MAFFRSFLAENGQQPDTDFTEQDEAALVFFLLQVRLRGLEHAVSLPPDFQAPEHIPPTVGSSAVVKRHLKFISSFLCFFVAKPMAYMREIRAFRNYFIPGFAADRDKQIQLGQALREEFLTAQVDDLIKAETLDEFFDITAISTEVVTA